MDKVSLVSGHFAYWSFRLLDSSHTGASQLAHGQLVTAQNRMTS